MNACNFIETANIYPNLNDEQQFKLNKINEIKDYFIVEIKERELMSKILSKYIVSFDYFDKSLFFLSATGDNISIALFATYWITCTNSKCKSSLSKSCIFSVYRNCEKIVKNNA